MESPSRWRWSAAVLAVALVSKGLALWAPFIEHDDHYYVVENWKLQQPGLQGLGAIWSMADIGPNKSIEFFPVRDTVYWVLFKAFGADPAPFHAANLALHLLVAWLVLALGRKFLSAEIAAFGALLFAAHPVHVESISWVSGLKDPLFSAFTLLSLLAFVAFRERGGASRYAAAVAALIAALSCKSLALGAPVVMLVIDRVLPGAPPWPKSVARVALPAAISALALVAFVLIGRQAQVLVPPHGGNWGEHAFLTAWAFVRYLLLAIAPHTLQLQYCFPPFGGAADLRWLGIALAAAALVALALKGRPRWAVALGAAWFLAFLLPVLNLVPFPSLMNDRYLYLPVAAACWAVAGVLMAVPRRQTGIVAAWTLVAAFSVQSLVRGLDWLDARVLYDQVADDPACAEDMSPPIATMMTFAAMRSPDDARTFALLRQVADHPGFLRNDRQVQCTELIEMARAAVKAQRWKDATFFAQRATQGCPEYLAGWQVLTQAALLVDPAAASSAAERAWTLSPGPAALFFRGMARLGAGVAAGEADVDAAVAQSPDEVCPHARALARVPTLPESARTRCGAK
jgi:hypothetical protein